MRIDKKPLKVVFRYLKDEGQLKVDEAFDLLFEEAFRHINQKPVLVTK